MAKAETLTKAERWERTHAQLRGIASRLVKTRGLRLPSLAEVMQGAELTVGGFYGHWASKEALFVEALRAAMHGNWNLMIQASRGDTARERMVGVVRRYLSRTHRDLPAEGCPLPAVLGDVAALGEPYSGALAEELEAMAKRLGEAAEPIGGKQLALGLLAVMVGGLSLARATAGTPLSDAVLNASRALAKLALERAEQQHAEKEAT
ncbi:MAG: TetR/AcrR family transcriptional regulator [Myxococcales bacterium]|nr:TetR/AcrR family transcriptional regulator [Myxococcales bacterium]